MEIWCIVVLLFLCACYVICISTHFIIKHSFPTDESYLEKCHIYLSRILHAYIKGELSTSLFVQK